MLGRKAVAAVLFRSQIGKVIVAETVRLRRNSQLVRYECVAPAVD
jgi:hypothetical protein